MTTQTEIEDRSDAAPGEREQAHTMPGRAIRNYAIGFVLAAAMTAGSFWAASGTALIYGPAVPMALAAFAIGQMGIHLVFFLHITTGPDNLNNVLALAFGVFIVGIVIAGSLWIMHNLGADMTPIGQMTDLQRQP